MIPRNSSAMFSFPFVTDLCSVHHLRDWLMILFSTARFSLHRECTFPCVCLSVFALAVLSVDCCLRFDFRGVPGVLWGVRLLHSGKIFTIWVLCFCDIWVGVICIICYGFLFSAFFWGVGFYFHLPFVLQFKLLCGKFSFSIFAVFRVCLMFLLFSDGVCLHCIFLCCTSFPSIHSYV